MAIRYSFSGKWEDYKELLRQFSLDSIIKAASIESTKLSLGDGTDHGHRMVLVPCTRRGSRIIQKKQVLITTWNLVDLSYFAVMATNDYRGRKVESQEDFYALCAANSNYMQKTEKDTIDPIKEQLEFLFYVWGFSGEQVKMQTPAYIFDNAARDLYMLFEISRKAGNIDYDDIIKRTTGVTWEEITASILIAWFCFSRMMDIRDMEKLIVWDESFRIDSFRSVISRYTTTYEEVRKSSLGRQIFYTKPYIRTHKGELLGVNGYLNLCLYEHCILWTVRDAYLGSGDNSFIINFGELFEQYLHELLSYYLADGQFKRIERVKNKKRADWKMELFGHKFLIEQKSSVLRLAAKQQESDYSATVDFASKNIIKALKQLEATERDLDDGEYIKIVLLYEDYLPPSIIDLVFALPECEIKDDNRYWLMTIDTMERFLDTYKNNPATFRSIIDDKMKSRNESTPGSIEHLLSEYGIEDNRYLKLERIRRYREYTQEFIRKHLVKSQQ